MQRLTHTSARTPPVVGAQTLRRDAAIGALLFVGALLLRLYHISANPLWLDEIYGYQLGSLGWRAFFINSAFDPHPPLYYLVQWVSSGFGLIHTEWAWRWFPALSGALAVPLVYRFARIHGVHWLAALLACGLLAISPMHMYFSQEARSPAFVMLLGALAMHALWQIQRQPDQRCDWLIYTLIATVGLYTSFSFAIVIGCQLVYMCVVLRLWRNSLMYGGVIALIFTPIILATVQVVAATSQKLAGVASVTPGQLVDSLLGGDIVRYGQHGSNSVIVGALAALAALGCWWGWRFGERRITLYLAFQVLAPLVGFFALAPILGVSLPASESKQFIAILPAFFVLVAQGVQLLGAFRDEPRRSGPRSAPWLGALGALCCAVLLCATIVASMINLQRYWTTARSPEGSAVLAVRAQMRPGDAIVSQHYSIDAALSFYLPDAPHFTKPQRIAKRYFFAQSLLVLPFPAAPKAEIAIKDIAGQYPRLWLLSLAAQDSDMQRDFARYCATDTQQAFGPFRATLFQQCQRRK